MDNVLDKVRTKVAEAWKAVVAVATPIILNLIVELLDAARDAVTTEGQVYLTALLTGVGVWFTRNRAQS